MTGRRYSFLIFRFWPRCSQQNRLCRAAWNISAAVALSHRQWRGENDLCLAETLCFGTAAEPAIDEKRRTANGELDLIHVRG